MDNFNQLIIKIARQPEALSDDDFAALARLCRDYPAAAAPAAAMLKYGDNRLTDEQRTVLRHRIALLAGDRNNIIAMIDPSGQGFDDFYPPEPQVTKPSTDTAIDTFLATYGHRSPEEDALLERMIFNPVPEYAETLAKSEPAPSTAPAGSQDSLIDAFLAANPVDEPSDHLPIQQEPTPEPPQAPVTPSKEDSIPNNSLLSESLAKIFIKQQRYDRAYEIIANLNLNYPEKSCYFADQLRFLRKLMINQRHTPGNKAQ